MNVVERVYEMVQATPEFAGQAWMDDEHEVFGIEEWCSFVEEAGRLGVSFFIQAHPLAVATLMLLLARTNEPVELLESYDYDEDGEMVWGVDGDEDDEDET